MLTGWSTEPRTTGKAASFGRLVMTKAGPTKLAGDLPQMVVFDLDYTLWDAWCDTHVTPPLLRRNDDLNKVYDRHGQPLSFYRDVPEVLLNLHHSEVHVAAASRTHAPKVARQILSELLLPGSLRDSGRGDLLKARSSGGKETISAIQLFDSMEIYPGSKLSHFRELNKQTGIPFEQMVRGFLLPSLRTRPSGGALTHFALVLSCCRSFLMVRLLEAGPASDPKCSQKRRPVASRLLTMSPPPQQTKPGIGKSPSSASRSCSSDRKVSRASCLSLASRRGATDCPTGTACRSRLEL